ncbi:hypothetical protein PC116_g24350 [Phytophthora cactorum]|uniref:Apple domain-containing protein n=1 Tax=Phytophthora cactorum TaxID=29920 RepID=A0A329SWT6_9STRA|nr:hypothetical protein PC117_g22048 [Phytophthora cactorum]KAG3133413.1 hypothetical protein C6341_g22539 [Phytophthora cactorum]KAG4227253.1 hypothetical protein PC116_g24350 [Phytophthora cactorum]RAW40288.1 hypothetical protein PC110_g3543 [Phytophthora cactorum]
MSNVFVADGSAMRDGTVNPCGFIMYIGREAADQAKAYIAANTGGTGATCSTAENNIDYIGNDLTSRTSSTASGCCAICAATSGCKPYSWSGGTCWLKSAKGTTQSKSGFISASSAVR